MISLQLCIGLAILVMGVTSYPALTARPGHSGVIHVVIGGPHGHAPGRGGEHPVHEILPGHGSEHGRPVYEIITPSPEAEVVQPTEGEVIVDTTERIVTEEERPVTEADAVEEPEITESEQVAPTDKPVNESASNVTEAAEGVTEEAAATTAAAGGGGGGTVSDYFGESTAVSDHVGGGTSSDFIRSTADYVGGGTVSDNIRSTANDFWPGFSTALPTDAPPHEEEEEKSVEEEIKEEEEEEVEQEEEEVEQEEEEVEQEVEKEDEEDKPAKEATEPTDEVAEPTEAPEEEPAKDIPKIEIDIIVDFQDREYYVKDVRPLP